MTANSLYRTVGALSLPLSDTDATDATSLDPGRDILLNLLAAALNDELAARWTDAAAGTVLAGTDPVESTCPDELDSQYLQSTEHPHPVLAVYRNGAGNWVELDSGQMSLEWGFSVDYILGPLTVGERRKMGDFLAAAARVLLVTVERGGHLAYAATPYHPTQPKLVLGPTPSLPLGGTTDTANFSSCRIEPNSIRRGAAGFSNDTAKYWAVSFNIATTEVESFTAGDFRDVDYDGGTLSLATGTITADDPDELLPFIPDLVQARTDQDVVFFEGEAVTFDDESVTYSA